MILYHLIVFRMNKILPARIAEFNHIAHHGSGNKRKIRIGAIFNLNMVKSVSEPMSVIRTAGIINIRTAELRQTLIHKIEHIFRPLRRIVNIKQADNFQPRILRTVAINVLNHLLPSGIIQRITLGTLLLNGAENNRHLFAFAQHLVNHLGMADMKRLGPHNA